MIVARFITVVIMLSALGIGALDAQSLRNAAPPVVFPPASFKGKQFVDSRGCIYIRAGIDGNVTWVPRVSRSRKQVCGFAPTAVAGGTSARPAKPVGTPVIITLPDTATATIKPVPAAKAAPAVIAKSVPVVTPAATVTTPAKPQRKARVGSRTKTPAKVRRARATVAAQPDPAPNVGGTRSKPSPAPAPTVFSSARSATAATTPAVRTIARLPWYKRNPFKRRTAPAPVRSATVLAETQPRVGQQVKKCPNASAFSQQFINDPADGLRVRCGPQSESPIAPGQGWSHSSRVVAGAAGLPANTRVVRRHIYDNRQNTQTVKVPAGYRTVWGDDRLNPHRAERTLRPAQITNSVNVPKGYRRSGRDDDRLNPNRGIRTAQGDASSNQIWSNTVPRVLLSKPTRGRIVTIPKGTARAQAPETVLTRLSTRSAPKATSAPVGQTGKRLYVRVAVYAAKSDARAVAKGLARRGLPMQLGRLKTSGNKIVLAGPFSSIGAANAALTKVRQAGFQNARLSK